MIKCSNSAKWEQLSFDEAVEPVSDGGKRVDQRDYRPSGALPVIDQGESFIGGYTDDLSKSYTGPLPVVVFGDHTRRVKLVNERFAVGAQGVKLLRPREGWDPKFFAYLLPTLPIPNRGYSRHYQFVRKLTFRRPDLPEQQRIVAEIEKQFTRLDAGVASLKRVQAALKRHRASLLKTACEGRLVPTEAELARNEKRSYETGEQLLHRILKERRERWTGKGQYKEPIALITADLPQLPGGWTYVLVETVGSVQLGRQRAPKHHTGANLRPYLRVANVYEDRIDLSDIKDMNFTPQEFEIFRLEPNDILLNEGQSLELVGRPALYRGELPGACFTNTLVRFRPFAALNVKFALLVFRAFMHSGRFQKIARWTTNIAHLGADRFAKMAFPLPPLAEQTRIVAEVERRLSAIESLQTQITANVQRAARLRQSILSKAFSGTSTV